MHTPRRENKNESEQSHAVLCIFLGSLLQWHEREILILELQPFAEEECEGAEPSKMIGDQEQSEDEEETIG